MKKLVIGTALALAAFAATPSFAARYHARMPAQQPYATGVTGYEAYAAVDSGFATNAPVQYAQDPDPTVRVELIRQGNPANISGN